MLVNCCTRLCRQAFILTLSEHLQISFRRSHGYFRHSSPLSLDPEKNVWHCDRRNYAETGAVSCQKLESRSVVEVCGTDALAFLQGLVTNDVQLLETSSSGMYAMMLNVQGRVLYDLFLYRLKAEKPTIFVECDSDVSAELVTNLLRYKMRKKLEVTDIGNDFSVWSVFAEHRRTPDVRLSNKDVAVCARDPRHESFGHRVLLPATDSGPMVAGASLTSASYETWRCEAGVGEGTADFPPGQCFPLESNLDFMNGVSFSKGCYIGQELTARTNYTGVIRKRIMPLTFSNATQDVPPGAAIVNSSGKECGKVRGVCGSHGLGLLRIDDVVGKGTMQVQLEESTVAEAETRVPSWWPAASDAVIQQAVIRTEKNSAND